MLISFGNENPIDVEILGYDLKISEKLAEEVAAIVRSTPGAKDVRVSREPDYPQQNIVIDRERAALLGLSVGQVAKAVQTFINGYEASIFSDPQTGNQYDINVRARESDRTSLSDLGQIFVFNPQGRPISLDNIATISARGRDRSRSNGNTSSGSSMSPPTILAGIWEVWRRISRPSSTNSRYRRTSRST